MKSFAAPECGQSNAVVSLARNFGQSNQRLPATVSAPALSSTADSLANEYLRAKAAQPAPASFNMQSLTTNLPQNMSAASTSLANKWASEFAQAPMSSSAQLATNWTKQYNLSRPVYSQAWTTAQAPMSSTSMQMGQGTSHDFWSAEYLKTVDDKLKSPEEMGDLWAREMLSNHEGREQDVWHNNSDAMEAMWKDIQRRCEEAQGETFETPAQYTYQEQNPYLSELDPKVLGDRLMGENDAGNAMLAYEAAVQKNDQDADAWCRLGLAHAENEEDKKAIAALQKCIAIQPNNEEALLALSVSMANEGMDNESLFELQKWLVAHQGGDVSSITKSPNYSSFLNETMFAKVEQEYLNVARQQGGTADAALQNALGVLYNLNRNYERAVDCIKIAIAIKPEDPRLWNRLGATLANGDRTPEAVAAYREALQRYPTYVRARYNLGISCMQLASHREALDHFLSALELQKGDKMSSTIWSTMWSAALRLRDAPPNLTPAIDNRDIQGVKQILQSFAS
ncbi:hypothetical protein WR25_13539 [Diploscapter pachys]|uniref:Uncharacterized protein n=1 Tax=Diploscapter pachys TaxID=2018661 RepID=A0A2A2JCV8_9BILA|nr:hypothetical protein WR25_13539 [Diploscapter pachys]